MRLLIETLRRPWLTSPHRLCVVCCKNFFCPWWSCFDGRSEKFWWEAPCCWLMVRGWQVSTKYVSVLTSFQHYRVQSPTLPENHSNRSVVVLQKANAMRRLLMTPSASIFSDSLTEILCKLSNCLGSLLQLKALNRQTKLDANYRNMLRCLECELLAHIPTCWWK